MKYRIQRKNYRDFEVYEQNKRAPRAYFIPYGDEELLRGTPLKEQRYASDLVQVLSGEWDFCYFSDSAGLPKELDTECAAFDKINLPSVWQRTGYENPVYLNTRYAFDNAPPELPERVSVGVYRRVFHLERVLNRNILLAFLGVAGGLDVYLNGYHVGYSETAHNTAEFDLSGVAREGENELLAVVHKWSTGTFLECQDMFRENGIFRDVLLYDLPRVYLNDFFLRPQRQPEGWYRLQVTAEILGDLGSGWSLDLRFEELEQVYTGAAKERMSFSLDKLRVKEWNAEEPVLYHAWLRLKKDGQVSQCVRVPLGFKSVKIEGELFRFNGEKIKLKGVNHHDTDPVKGYCMSFEDYERDLGLMKRCNVNAIRTSHYPPDPHLLQLADKMGFYLIDEADIETHGMGGEPHNNIHGISDDKLWIPRYLDRTKRMLFRDRNHACVTLWSLGNEAGGHHCQDACYAFLHAVHPEIPVHYEGVCGIEGVWSYDVHSEMYTHPDQVTRVGRGEAEKWHRGKPFFLCEYAHAMGVGPGGMEAYWEAFHKYDNLMGGCVWEWADHAVDHGPDAPLRWTYGGDHGEARHDGNFCVDGLVYPDRGLHTGALVMKNIYRPIRASLMKKAAKGSIRFTNTNRFASAGGIIAAWALLRDGLPIAQGIEALSAAPKSTEELHIVLPKFKPVHAYHLNIRYLDAEGFEIAAEQLVMQDPIRNSQFEIYKSDIPVHMSEDENRVYINSGSAELAFSKETGALSKYQLDGRELLAGDALLPNVLRASLDNDKTLDEGLRKSGLDQMLLPLESIAAAKQEDGAVLIQACYHIIANQKPYYTVRVKTLARPGGVLTVTASIEPIQPIEGAAAELPRFGLTLPLIRALDQVRYFGLGDKENLPDLRAHVTLGVFETTVAAMHEPYLFPQENGTRGEVRWLTIADDQGRGLRFEQGSGPFHFTAHHYTQAALAQARHQEELKEEDLTFLSIDGFMRGAGTNSCGPDTLPQYRVNASEGLSFQFSILNAQCSI
ncbi:MAG: hypothetical protein FWH26_05650 [Oscillospiraceae bacterium]|nr:hypothetical protein [Oscillospiraceae bacterium]